MEAGDTARRSKATRRPASTTMAPPLTMARSWTRLGFSSNHVGLAVRSGLTAGRVPGDLMWQLRESRPGSAPSARLYPWDVSISRKKSDVGGSQGRLRTGRPTTCAIRSATLSRSSTLWISFSIAARSTGWRTPVGATRWSRRPCDQARTVSECSTPLLPLNSCSRRKRSHLRPGSHRVLVGLGPDLDSSFGRGGTARSKRRQLGHASRCPNRPGSSMRRSGVGYRAGRSASRMSRRGLPGSDRPLMNKQALASVKGPKATNRSTIGSPVISRLPRPWSVR